MLRQALGGLVLQGDTMFAATRRGEVWRIDGVNGDAPKATLWAEGLMEPLGLVERDGWLYCAQRAELSRMRDRDGDGRMDELETVADGWPISGNYHEYCFGPTVAGDGSFWLTLNKPFGGEPFGKAPWRGWAIRIPAGGGSFEPGKDMMATLKERFGQMFSGDVDAPVPATLPAVLHKGDACAVRVVVRRAAADGYADGQLVCARRAGASRDPQVEVAVRALRQQRRIRRRMGGRRRGHGGLRRGGWWF